MEKVTKEKEDEDRRREAALRSTPSLQHSFKPSGVSQDQLSKFRELHRRRLKLKSKSKFQYKSKDGEIKTHWKVSDDKHYEDGGKGLSPENFDASHLQSDRKEDCMTMKGDAKVPIVPKKRQKLHWGLDTKERWERKANM